MFIDKIDYILLREQKATLVKLNEIFDRDSLNGEALDGIIALIDAVQDYAVDMRGMSELDVFGTISEGDFISNDMVSKASQFLVNEDVSVKEQLRAIIKQNEIDSTELIDNIDGVQVWEIVEFRFSCEAFLNYLK